MIEILEHNLPPAGFSPDGSHKKFIKALKRELDKFTPSRPLDQPICVSIRYGIDRPRSIFGIKGYDSGKFPLKDDITLATLRANLDYLVKEEFGEGIDGNRFQMVLAFTGDPFKEADKQDRKPTGEEPAFNVLPVMPRYRLDQMILEDKILEQLEDVITLVNLQDKIYDQWGFGEVDPKPRAIINFFGPSGTGKTMAAHALANRFGKKILALNYADIESKFVGDAPKNLMAAFEVAKKYDAVLFFDEADSFLGKRITNVTQSADQAVNSLRSQMLMLLEEHSGTVIFATNLIENYDSAFKSRILKHIKFSLPVPELRLALINKMTPSRLPRNEEEFSAENLDRLVELSDGFSGREIKNAMLNGIIRSARAKEQADFADILASFESAASSRNEQDKKPSQDNLRKRIRNKLRKALGFGKKGRKQKVYRTVKVL